jgi:trehalose synthase
MTSHDLQEVDVHAVAIDRLAQLLGPERAERFTRVAEAAQARLSGRRVINVNSTATGGGVAELLQTLLAYARGAGVDARWVVVEGDPGFFEITKRIHNHLYGTAGDGGQLEAGERHRYEDTISRNAAGLNAVVRAGDIVVLHDPQTVGLTRHLIAPGVQVVWRCHVGIDTQNEHSEQAWAFLRPYLEGVDACVYSRAQFAPPWMPREQVAVIHPSIDPFSAKNDTIEPTEVTRLLQHVGLLAGQGTGSAGSFPRRDGSRGEVTRRVDLLGTGPPPDPSIPMVLQASRWDVMKDMPGVMTGFAESVAPRTDAHLVLAGPEAAGVADDPEANDVLRDCLDLWARLPAAMRRRIHLVCVPMADGDEAAAIVNAVQQHATVVVQKSLAEGFGLTVAEAMWKQRPVVGSAVGGIVDQIIHGETGFLVAPRDQEEYAGAVCSILDDRRLALQMGVAGRERVTNDFLGDRHLEEWAVLFERLP